VENVTTNRAIYPIGVVAELLEVHPRTLRLYEQAGFICPRRRRGRRYYSEGDVEWLRCIRALIHEEKISIEGLRRLLELQPCWAIRGCDEEKRRRCHQRKAGSATGARRCERCGSYVRRNEIRYKEE
jgi:DNA-binding transcriptional MerR regulator